VPMCNYAASTLCVSCPIVPKRTTLFYFSVTNEYSHLYGIFLYVHLHTNLSTPKYKYNYYNTRVQLHTTHEYSYIQIRLHRTTSAFTTTFDYSYVKSKSTVRYRAQEEGAVDGNALGCRSPPWRRLH
jgi:hypothetical protein